MYFGSHLFKASVKDASIVAHAVYVFLYQKMRKYQSTPNYSSSMKDSCSYSFVYFRVYHAVAMNMCAMTAVA